MAGSMQATSSGARHALVIGGSMAGLLAARVLADYFDRVTIVERDYFPVDAGPRKGVPQARHAHVLLARGTRLLEQLFPGVGGELAAAGAPEVDWARDAVLVSAAGLAPRFSSGLVTFACTRDLLESIIRQRVAAHPRVTFLQGVEGIGLLPDTPGTGVAGARVRYRESSETRAEAPVEDPAGAGDRPDVLRAGFVVDASGRTSRAPEWLAELGYPEPEEDVINSFLGYASRWYEHPKDFAPGWQGALISGRPPQATRVGVVYPVEGDRWIITLSGAARDYPPLDEAGFAEFARSLPVPAVYDAICAGRPVSAIYGYRRTENRWRHYERLDRWPERFVVLGDAVCAFNPVYGQGMTAGALAALALGRALQRGRPDLAGVAWQFQRKVARTVSPIWLLATGADFRYPQTEGGRPGRLTRFMHRYIDRVLTLGIQNARVQKVFLEVTHLIRPPAALFRPGVLIPVAGQALRHVRLAGNRAYGSRPDSPILDQASWDLAEERR